MAVRLFEQQQVAELVFIAQKREVVLAAALAFQLARTGVEHARLPDVVQREVGVREFFLELRVGGDEFDHALAQHQRVVAEARHVKKQRGFLVHRFSTPSGMS